MADELAAAAGRLADALDAVTDGPWARRGRRGDGASFTVSTFAPYLWHDVSHHLHDVGA
ncbi:MAG: hypothetical protein S0880_23350 [Actinomycetota bacterium]|nr:hypothetical protein [Actinomycetota bacterium]